MPQSGQLRPAGRDFHVWLNSRESTARRRFSHAHEICHLLIPGYLSNSKCRTDATTGEYRRQQEEEYLCDVGASELLMPVHMFAPSISRPLHLDSLLEVARRFDVSLEAAGIRLTQCDIEECAVIVWEEALKKSQIREMKSQAALPGMERFAPRPRLRIRFASTSPGMRKHYFPPERSADAECLVNRCLEIDSVVSGNCYLPTGNGLVEFATESIDAPYRRGNLRQNRVITIARPKRRG